jgi:hypothetical protein
MLTKIALAAALVIGSVSVTLAKDAKDNDSKALAHAHASYALSHERPSPTVDQKAPTEPAATNRPLTQFEKNWFDYQAQQ